MARRATNEARVEAGASDPALDLQQGENAPTRTIPSMDDVNANLVLRMVAGMSEEQRSKLFHSINMGFDRKHLEASAALESTALNILENIPTPYRTPLIDVLDEAFNPNSTRTTAKTYDRLLTQLSDIFHENAQGLKEPEIKTRPEFEMDTATAYAIVARDLGKSVEDLKRLRADPPGATAETARDTAARATAEPRRPVPKSAHDTSGRVREQPRAEQIFKNLPEGLARPYSKEPVPDEVLTPENVSTAYRIQNAVKRRKPEAKLIDPADKYLAGRIIRAHEQRPANG